MSDTTPAAPALRVTAGNPTPEELAALVLVLSAASSDAPEQPEVSRSMWNHRGYGMRNGGAPGSRSPWAWRTGGFR